MHNVVQFNPTIYNEELTQLHKDLIAFANNVYGDTIKEKANQLFPEVEYTNLLAWEILQAPVNEYEETVFELFYLKREGNFQFTRTEDIFTSWGERTPSVYQVTTTDAEQNKASIKDIHTEEVFQVSFHQKAIYQAGTFLSGILVPFVEYHKFLHAPVVIDKKEEVIVESFYLHYDQEDRFMKNYPALLCQLLSNSSPTSSATEVKDTTIQLKQDQAEDQVPAPTTERQSTSIDWAEPIYEQVAQQFSEQMLNKGIKDQLIKHGIVLWEYYCNKKNPKLKNPATYAAALDYLIHTSYVEEHNSTQSSVAKEYGTSAGTVSSNYRKLITELEEQL